MGRIVTERRRSERELAAAKERLELALEGSNASLWDTDLRTGKVYLGEGWAEFQGLPRAPTATTIDGLMQGVHAQDLPRAVKLSMEVVKGERADYAEEHRYRTADGGWKWLLSRGKVSERDDSGRALRMTGINIDITARKRAEQAMREAEERYRMLVEMTPDGVVVHANGIIEYANAEAARILRADSPKALLGVHIGETIDPAQADRLPRAAAVPAAGARARGFRGAQAALPRRQRDGGRGGGRLLPVAYIYRRCNSRGGETLAY